MTHVFLSYAREDADDAMALHDALDRNGFSVWLDSKSLLPGQRWRDEVERAIKGSAAFVVLISKNSTNKRGYVQKEHPNTESVSALHGHLIQFKMK